MPIHSSEYTGRLEVILSGRIYFSSPTYFNDPFEMSSLLAPLERNAFEGRLARSGYFSTSPSQKRAAHRRYLEAFNAKASPALAEDWIDALGVLCLTTQKNNLLMWAHYAANHSGVCIGFDSEHAPFSEAKPVEYSEQRPAISSETADDHLVRAALMTKSPHWSYEKEWRAIKRPISDDEKEYYKSLITSDPSKADSVAELLATQGGGGLYEFDPKAIRVICLGARIKSCDAEKVVEIVQNNSPHVRVEEAKLDARYYQLNFTRRTRYSCDRSIPISPE